MKNRYIILFFISAGLNQNIKCDYIFFQGRQAYIIQFSMDIRKILYSITYLHLGICACYCTQKDFYSFIMFVFNELATECNFLIVIYCDTLRYCILRLHPGQSLTLVNNLPSVKNVLSKFFLKLFYYKNHVILYNSVFVENYISQQIMLGLYLLVVRKLVYIFHRFLYVLTLWNYKDYT